MKNLTTASFVTLLCLTLMASTSNAQTLKKLKNEFGIKAGLEQPYYHGGDPAHRGIERTSSMLTAGVYDILPLGRSVKLRLDLLYSSQGAKNPNENNRVFKPKYLLFSPLLVIGSGKLTFDVGPYYQTMISALDWDFTGSNFTWKTRKWYYIKNDDAGANAALTYNFINVRGSVGYTYGFMNVRPGPGKRGNFNDPNMAGNKNTAITASLLFAIFN